MVKKERIESRRYLKVPEGAVKIANDANIYQDLFFYYQLKSINPEGFFSKKEFVRLIKNKFNYSQSSIYRKMRSLVNLGFINKSTTGYHLISYDALFSLLGYDMTYNKKKKRRGSFKIFKLSLDDINHFLENIARGEIELNLNRQTYVAWKRVKNSDIFNKLPRNLKAQYRSKCMDHISIREVIEDLYKNSDKVAQFKEYLSAHITKEYLIAKGKYDFNSWIKENNVIPGLDITLSNRGIARLMGFKSVSKAFNLQNSMNVLGLIKSQRRSLFLNYSPLNTFSSFKSSYSLTHHSLDNGAILLNLPNKVTIL